MTEQVNKTELKEEFQQKVCAELVEHFIGAIDKETGMHLEPDDVQISLNPGRDGDEIGVSLLVYQTGYLHGYFRSGNTAVELIDNMRYQSGRYWLEEDNAPLMCLCRDEDMFRRFQELLDHLKNCILEVFPAESEESVNITLDDQQNDKGFIHGTYAIYGQLDSADETLIYIPLQFEDSPDSVREKCLKILKLELKEQYGIDWNY